MLLDILFALFAALGIFYCFFAAVCLFLPRHAGILLVDCRNIRSSDDLWGLLWRLSACPLPRRILLVDSAISQEERLVLCGKYPIIEFCTREQLISRLELENAS